MQKLLKTLKPFDYILTAFALLLSFIPLILTLVYNQPQSNNIAVIKMNGDVVDQFVLSEDADRLEKTYYPAEGLYNTIEQVGDQIRVKADNSPDQIAVKTGWLSEVGDIAICLPHRFVVEVQGEQSFSEENLILPFF